MDEDQRQDQDQELREATAGSDRRIRTIEEWMAADANRPESEEERRRRERRERSRRIIGAVADGLSALGNMVTATQYGPSVYDPERDSRLKAEDERLGRLRADRDGKRERYERAAMRLGELEDGRARTVRDLGAQQEQRRLAREKADREAELHPFVKAIREAEGRKAEQQAIASQAEAEYTPRIQEAKLVTEQARAEASRAAAANSYASAAAHNRTNANEFSAWDEYGNEHKFRTEAAAIAFAKQHGTYQETEQSETTHTIGKSAQGRLIDQTATKTTRRGHAARPQKKKSPTSGGEGGVRKSPTS